MPDLSPQAAPSPVEAGAPPDAATSGPAPTPGTKAALQSDLDAARARITALEGELAEATSTSATVAADRDAAVAQLAEAGERIDALQRLAERSRGESTMHDLLGLLERLTRATESQALAALARVAELEAQLGTALADRDAAVEQLRGAVPSSDPRRVFEDLARRFVVATEVQAILALAATRTGRDASTLRELAAGYLAQTTSAR